MRFVWSKCKRHRRYYVEVYLGKRHIGSLDLTYPQWQVVLPLLSSIRGAVVEKDIYSD